MKVLIKFLLFCSFLGLFGYSMYKIILGQLGTRIYVEEGSSLPSLTICPQMYKSGVEEVSALASNITFQDLEKIPSMKEMIKITVRRNEAYKIQTRLVRL